MSIEKLKNRYKDFAIAVAELIRELPMNNINIPYSNQLIRSSSSSAANYRAACRGKSTPDFINKHKIVEEELDESIFFLELLSHFNPVFNDKIKLLINEGNELLAITVQSIITARKNQKNEKK
ncbi:MAG: four helix bundle protein [Bacteroidales bacterium]|nr:four helix bundle protein [Bacteroidales bacterium]